ncbi:hypothetical protein BGW42_007655 [Actinomortierella wolfii]|nr:hypothetical protein BGW42_007655 [Actinomortierella wolfii]
MSSSYTSSSSSKYDQYGQNTWNYSQQHQNAQPDYEHDPSGLYYRQSPPQHGQGAYGRTHHGVSTDSTGAFPSTRMRSGSNASSLASYSASTHGQFSSGYHNQNQYIPTNKGHSSVLSTSSQSWSHQNHQTAQAASGGDNNNGSIHSVSNPISVRSRSGSNNSTVPPARPPRPSEDLNLDMFQQGTPGGGAHDFTAAHHHPHHYPQQDYFGTYGVTQQQVEQQQSGYRPTYQSRSSSLMGSAQYLYQSDQHSQQQQQPHDSHQRHSASSQASSRVPRHSNDIARHRQSPTEERVSMESSVRSNGSGRRARGGDPSHHHLSDQEQLPSIDQYEEMLQKIASPPLGPSSGRGHRRTEQERQASRAARQARKQQQQQQLARAHPDLILEAADEASYLDTEVLPVPKARSRNQTSLTADERKQRRRSSLPAALRTSPTPKVVEELKRRSSGGISPKEIAKAVEMRFGNGDNSYETLKHNSHTTPKTQDASALDSQRSSGQRRSWEIESVIARSDIIEGLERTSSWRQRPAPEPKSQQNILSDDIYGGTTDMMGYVPPPPPPVAAGTQRKNSWDGALDDGVMTNNSNNGSNMDLSSSLSLPPRGPLPTVVPPPPTQPMPPPPPAPAPAPPAMPMNDQPAHDTITDLRRKTSTGSVASIKNHSMRSDYRSSTDLKRQLLHTAASDDELSDGGSSSYLPYRSAGRRESQQHYGSPSAAAGVRSESRASVRSSYTTAHPYGSHADDMMNGGGQQRANASSRLSTSSMNGLKSIITPPQKSHLRNSYTLTPPSPDDEHIIKPFVTPLDETERIQSAALPADLDDPYHQSQEPIPQAPMTPVSAPLTVPPALAQVETSSTYTLPPSSSASASAASTTAVNDGEDDDEIRQFQLQLEQLNSAPATATRSGSGGRRSREEARSARHTTRHEESHQTTSSIIPEEEESSQSTTKEAQHQQQQQQQPLSPSSPTMPRRPLTPTSRSATPTSRHRPATPNSGGIIRPPPGPAPTPTSTATSPVMRKSALPRTTTAATSASSLSSPPSSSTITLPPPPPSSIPLPPPSSSNSLSAPVPIPNGSGRSRAGSTASVGSVTSQDRSLLGTTPPPPSSPLPSLPPAPAPPPNAPPGSSMQARRARKMSLGGNNSRELPLPPPPMDSELAALAGDLASVPLPPLPLPAPPPPPPPASGSSPNVNATTTTTTPPSSTKSLRHRRERTHDRDSSGSTSASSSSSMATTATTMTTATSLSSTTSSATSSPQQVSRSKQRVHSLEKELETVETQMSTDVYDSADLKAQMDVLVQERDALQARVAALEEEKQAKAALSHGGDKQELADSSSSDNINNNYRLSSLQLKLESLEQTRVELERELSLAREDSVRMQGELEALHQERLNNNNNNNNINNTSRHNHHHSASNQEHEEALHLLRQQLQDLQAERDAETAQRQDLERELDKAKLRAEQEEMQYRALQESVKRQSSHAALLEKQHAREIEELQTKHQRVLDQMAADHADALTRLAIQHEEETQRVMDKFKAELETMEQQLAVQKQVQQEIQSQVRRDNLLMEKERDEARWRAKFLQSKIQDHLRHIDQLESQLETQQRAQSQVNDEWEDARERWRLREQELDHRYQAAQLEAQRYQRECAKLQRIVQMLDESATATLALQRDGDQSDDEDGDHEQQIIRGAFEKLQEAWQAQMRSLERRLAKAEQEAAQDFESNLHKLVGLEYSPLDSQDESM